MKGYEALRAGAAWMDISPRGKIRVTGEDRVRLVHAMTTNDVKNLQHGEGLYAFLLNDKGRILADAYISNFGDSLFIDTEAETGRKVFEHLDHYLIADDAELADETNKWDVIALEGPKALETASATGISVPAKNNGIATWNNGFVARVRSAGTDGIHIFIPAGEKQNLIDLLAKSNVAEADAEAARVVRIENGLPRYGEEITERYLVQETQQMHAVHPNKGCYLGQEIVERVRTRGQVHRVLMPVRIKTTEPPQAGTKLTIDGKDVAEIASAAYSPALGEVVAMAYVRTEAAMEKPVMTVSGSGPAVEAILLPVSR